MVGEFPIDPRLIVKQYELMFNRELPMFSALDYDDAIWIALDAINGKRGPLTDYELAPDNYTDY